MNRTLRLNIKNEENGQTYQVTSWGERVPHHVYERIGQDKGDDGKIQDNVVTKKQKGFLEERVIMSGVQKQGQITQW